MPATWPKVISRRPNKIHSFNRWLRSYEHTMLVTHRNVYESVAAKIIKDGTAELKATRPTKSKGTR